VVFRGSAPGCDAREAPHARSGHSRVRVLIRQDRRPLPSTPGLRATDPPVEKVRPGVVWGSIRTRPAGRCVFLRSGSIERRRSAVDEDLNNDQPSDAAREEKPW